MPRRRPTPDDASADDANPASLKRRRRKPLRVTATRNFPMPTATSFHITSRCRATQYAAKDGGDDFLVVRRRRVPSVMGKLAEWVSGITALVSIFVNGVPIGDSGATQLALAMEANTTVQHLCLQDTAIRAVGMVAIAKMLTVNTTLKLLIAVGNYVGLEGVVALTEALKVNTGLRRLEFGDYDLQDFGIEFPEAMKINCGLLILGLSVPLLGPDAVRGFAEVLAMNTPLKKLFVGVARGFIEPVQQVATALSTNTHLKVLAMSGASLGYSGGLALGKMLASNSTLATLMVGGWDLGPAGVRAVMRGLSHNATLVSLGIDGSGIGNIGIAAILGTLRNNLTLNCLGWNRFGFDDPYNKKVDEVDECLLRNGRIADYARTVAATVMFCMEQQSVSPTTVLPRELFATIARFGRQIRTRNIPSERDPYVLLGPEDRSGQCEHGCE